MAKRKRKRKAGPGDSYRSAWHLITFVGVTSPSARLAHGYPRYTGRGRRAGRRFGHAWIEIGETVIDIEANAAGDKAGYYRVGRIDSRLVRLYSRAEALELAKRHGHYGPFEKPPGDAMFAR